MLHLLPQEEMFIALFALWVWALWRARKEAACKKE